MKRYLFDTNSISLTFNDSLPEKWRRFWKEVRMGSKGLLLFEPLISEIYYKNIPKHGKQNCKNKIIWLKSLQKTEIHQLNDRDAINAGDLKIQFSRYDLSLVDCFLLSIAKANKAMIVTTDHSVREVARKLNVNVSFLPFPSN